MTHCITVNVLQTTWMLGVKNLRPN